MNHVKIDASDVTDALHNLMNLACALRQCGALDDETLIGLCEPAFLECGSVDALAAQIVDVHEDKDVRKIIALLQQSLEEV